MTYIAEPDVDFEDTFEVMHRIHRFRLQLQERADVVPPIDGKDIHSITTALELAQCYIIPGVIGDFCAVGLGHRLIPVGEAGSAGFGARPTIDQALTPNDLAEISDEAERGNIIEMLRIWADIMGAHFDLETFDRHGWVGGRVAHDASGRTYVLWPCLFRPYNRDSACNSVELTA